LDRLRRYIDEEDTRMQTLAESFHTGNKVAAITAAVNVYVAKQNQPR
jgi:pyruvate carboxylase subunit A